MTRSASHLHAVDPRQAPADPLTVQLTAALGILATCAEASAQLADGSAELDRLPRFVRAKMERASVALAATVSDLQADVARIKARKEREARR